MGHASGPLQPPNLSPSYDQSTRSHDSHHALAHENTLGMLGTDDARGSGSAGLDCTVEYCRNQLSASMVSAWRRMLFTAHSLTASPRPAGAQPHISTVHSPQAATTT